MVNQQILLEDKVSLFFVENDSSPSNFQPLKMGRHVQKINISDCKYFGILDSVCNFWIN